MDYKGLTSEEAKKRLEQNGPNEIVSSNFQTRFEEIKKIFLDPMGLMLLVLAGLERAMGYKTDSLVLFISFFPVTAIDVLLELRTQRALKAMRSSLKSSAKVLRDGKIKEISIKEIVTDDVLIFEEGQSLPADGLILECQSLAVNESALTGESLTVVKNVGNSFFAGTTIVQGNGLGIIKGTGKSTQFGHIATLLEQTESQQSPLQKKVHFLFKRVIFIALGLAIFLFFLEWTRNKNITESLVIALTFGMAAIPEEFPLVFTLYLSLGAWRLSKKGVLIRSLPSVESLGSVDILCTDKTGTLTEGKFQLEKVVPVVPVAPIEKIWIVALMACEEKTVDSMEVAIKEKAPENFYQQLKDWKLTWDYPFEKVGKYMSHVWIHQKTSKTIISMKGAVEGVLEHCTVSEEEQKQILNQVSSYATQGHRILGIAMREGTCIGQREHDEKGLTFVALLLFSDPLRGSVADAVTACQNSGIEIKILTGDHPMTAHAIADQSGIRHSHDAIYTGAELKKMSLDQRNNAYKKGAIFSRIMPEQKYEMVQALKNLGKIVAMTGDGINDAPALKLADVGVSMGLNATDVARSAAKMILVKNDFNGLVAAVFEGRKIFENLKRSFSYLISFHIPIILLALVPPFLSWGELFLPIHIVLLELIVHPISAFAFENLPVKNKQIQKTLLPAKSLVKSVSLGLGLSIIALVLFRWQSHDTNITNARKWAMAAVLGGNMLFVIIESDFSFTKRVNLTLVSLFLAAYFIFSFVPLARLFHLGF
ncbi:MAG: cation-translocating P-type ATPase [Pseudobdellovibrionaceae bacterium]